MKLNTIGYVLAISLFSATAMANELDVQLRVGSQVAEDSSFDAIQDDNLLSYTTLQFGYAPGGVDGLRLFFGYDNSTTPGQSRLGALNLDWARYRFMLGGEYGVRMFGFLKPLVGVSAGYALQEMTFDASDVRTDYTHDVALEGYGGLDFVTDIATFETGEVLSLVAGGRLGWQMQTEARFDELDAEQSDGWTRPNNDIGVMNTDGLFWNIGVGLSLAF